MTVYQYVTGSVTKFNTPSFFFLFFQRQQGSFGNHHGPDCHHSPNRLLEPIWSFGPKLPKSECGQKLSLERRPLLRCRSTALLPLLELKLQRLMTSTKRTPPISFTFLVALCTSLWRYISSKQKISYRNS